MKPLLSQLDHPFTLTLGWALLHFVWQGAVIAALFLIARTLLQRRSANVRYIAACVSMLLMALCPVATLYFTQPQSGEIPILVHGAATPISVSETVVTTPVTATKSVTSLPVSIQATPRRVSLPQLQDALPWVVGIWLAGISVLSLRLFGGWVQVRRIKRQARESLGEFWELKLVQLSERLGVSRSVRLFKSALVEVPTVIGWLRPIILFPASTISGLSPAQLETILLHELAHIRRHDYLVNVLQNLVETLLFYHPAVWWISRCIRQERELCCDDLTVKICGDRLSYASALAALEEMRAENPAWALAARGGSLVRRIRRLAGVPEVETNRWSSWMAGATALVLIVALALASRTFLFAAIPAAESKTAAVQSPISVGQSVETKSISRSSDDSTAQSTPTNSLDEVRQLYDADKFDEAEAKVREALQRNPTNAIARFYLYEIQRAELASTGKLTLRNFGDHVRPALRDPTRAQELPTGAVLPSARGGGFTRVRPGLNQRLNSRLYYFDLAAGRPLDQAGWEEWFRAMSQDISQSNRTSGMVLARANPSVHTNATRQTPGRQRIQHLLDTVKLSEVFYDGIPLSEVAKDLSEKSVKLDPATQGINFVVNPHVDLPPPPVAAAGVGPDGLPLPAPPPPEPFDVNNAVIKLRLRNLTLGQVLDAVVKISDRPIKFSIEDYAIYFTQRSNDQPPLFTRTFRVNPNTFLQGLAGVVARSLGGGGFIGQRGVNRGGLGEQSALGGRNVGESVLSGGSQEVTTQTQTSQASELVRQFFALAGVNIQTNAATFDTNGNPITVGQKALFYHDRLGKLFVRATLDELDIIDKAIAMLNEVAPKEEKPNDAKPGANKEAPPAPDAEPAAEAKPERDAPNADPLAQTNQQTEQQELFTRAYQLNPRTVIQHLTRMERESQGFDPGGFRNGKFYESGFTNQPASDARVPILGDLPFLGRFFRSEASAAARKNLPAVPLQTEQMIALLHQFFVAAGVNLSTNIIALDAEGNPLPEATKGFFYNRQRSKLFVRATLPELAVVDKATQVLTDLPTDPSPLVTLEVKFMEVTQADSKTLGFDWNTGNPFGVFPRDPTAVSSIPGFPTYPSITTNTISPDGSRTNRAAVRGTGSASAIVTSILTEPQFRVVIRALEQRDNVKAVSVPKVTTASGRQVTINLTEASGTMPLPNPPFLATNTTARLGSSNALSAPVSLGRSIDIIPTVNADEFTIELAIIPSLVEFLGYDDPGPFIAQAQAVAGNTVGTPLTSILPLPKFRVRQVLSKITVWDGQTVMIGNLLGLNSTNKPNATPFPGNAAWVDRFYPSGQIREQSSDGKDRAKKNILIFITPTIVDPAGNRVHKSENLPNDPHAPRAQ